MALTPRNFAFLPTLNCRPSSAAVIFFTLFVGIPTTAESKERSSPLFTPAESPSDTVLKPEMKLFERGGPYSGYGNSISVTDRWALIGSPKDQLGGAAYVYEKEKDGTKWRLHTTLVPPENPVPGSASYEFGRSVSLSGDRALIGSPSYGRDGAAWVYRYDSKTKRWETETKLVIPVDTTGAGGAAYRLGLGLQVALEGNVAVVSSTWSKPGIWERDLGGVWVFKRDSPTGEWKLETFLRTDKDLRSGAHFGHDLDISGDRIIVGTRGYGLRNPAGRILDSHFWGAAFVFRWDDVKGSWMQEQRFLLDDPGRRDSFGNSVTISGDRIMIGAPTAAHEAGTPPRGSDWIKRGVAYSYHYDSSEERWVKDGRLLLETAGEKARFGSSVSLSQTGDTAVIGADGNSGIIDLSGTAHVYVYDQNAAAWKRTYDLMATEGRRFDAFGRSVAILDGDVLVGDPRHSGDNQRGAVFVFRLPK